MLLVFRSMLPPSHYQNKPVHLSPWILFFTFGHANAFRSSYTHLTTCAECTSCSTYTVYQNTHRVHSVLFSILSVTQAAADTKHSFPPTLSLSSFSHTPSHRLSFCLPLSSSSSPCFLPLLPVSWAATWSSNRHPRSRLFYCFVEWREREGEASQIIQSEGERMRGKKSTNIASRH